MRITTLTVNPCIDRTIVIGHLEHGKSHRIEKTILDFSGKGINVALALAELGADVTAVCADHEDGVERDFFEKCEDIKPVFVPAKGKARVNIKLFEENSRQMTEFNEKGPPADALQVDAFWQKLCDLSNKTDLMVMAGSVPPGFPTSFYQEVGMMLTQKKIPFIVDASKSALMYGIEAGPILIKPNAQEYEECFNTKPQATVEFCQSCRKMLDEKHIKYAVISFGIDGSLIVGPKGAWKAEPVKVDVKGLQGAGDSMVAGLAFMLAKHILDEQELLRFAVACASATIEMPGTEMCKKEEINKIIPRVCVTNLVLW